MKLDKKTYQEIKQWADYYFSLGLNVIPVSDQKVSLLSWKKWEKERMTDNEFQSIFQLKARQMGGIGVILGASRLVCLDFESKVLYSAYSRFLHSKGLTLSTWVSETNRGVHVFFTCDHEIRQLHVRDVFEILIDNHYAVLPPSLHPKGGRYRWISSPKEIPVPSLYPETVTEEFCECFVLNRKPITENNVTEKNITENNRRITENKDKGGDSQSSEEKNFSGDFTPFMYDFEYLKDCFGLFGFRKDSPEWKLDRKILCVHHSENNPSAKFIKMNDNRIGYTEFHSPIYGIKTYLGSLALVAHFLNRLPEDGILQDKYYFLLRGMKRVKDDFQAKGLTYHHLEKLREILSILETEESMLDSIVKALITVHVFHKANGENVFFISSRDVSSICRLDNHIMGNRILNLLCLLGFLEKQGTLESSYRADRYRIPENPAIDLDIVRKLKPLANLNRINRKSLSELDFPENQLKMIFKRRAEHKKMVKTKRLNDSNLNYGKGE